MKKLLILLVLVSTSIVVNAQRFKPFTESYAYMQLLDEELEMVEQHKYLTNITFNYGHDSYIRIKSFRGNGEDDKEYLLYLTGGWEKKNTDSGIPYKEVIVMDVEDQQEYLFIAVADFTHIMIIPLDKELSYSMSFTRKALKAKTVY